MAFIKRIDTGHTPTLGEALADFILFKQAQGLAERTLTDYKYHILRAFKWQEDAWPHDAKRVARAYLASAVAPATFNIRRRYLQAFFGWCLSEEMLTANPLAGIKRKYDEGRIALADENLLSRLLKLPNRKTYAGLRDYCLLLLTLDIGIRPGEALALMPEDVDTEAAIVTVRRGLAKTRRTRLLPISELTARNINRLLRTRHESWTNDAPVFCNYGGRPLRVSSWNHRFKRYTKQLGVEMRPYDLRHFFAVLYLRGGGHAHGLQRMLGHADLQMTKRYVHLTDEDIAHAHAKANPLGRLVDVGERVRRVPKG